MLHKNNLEICNLKQMNRPKQNFIKLFYQFKRSGFFSKIFPLRYGQIVIDCSDKKNWLPTGDTCN